MLCQDCVKCREELDRTGVEYAFLDFAEDLNNLKEFLVLRETSLFDEVRKEGRIGIPCILGEDGIVTLDWQTFM
jgi:glutaredoxin-related protein